MKNSESILRPLKKIHGGTTLPHYKNSAEDESIVMDCPATVTIPLVQHIGTPCEPVVAKGDKVFVGTKIGDSTAFVSAPVHSGVSGVVTKTGSVIINGKSVNCVTVETDGLMESDGGLSPFTVKTKEDIAAAARNCGLVGLGGAGFPTHVKLSFKEDTNVDTLIVNAAECEPYITADYRECIENYNDIIEGIYLLKDILQLKQVIICVESNKPRAIRKLYNIASDKRDNDDSVKLMELPSNYPQGAEKILIYSATGRVLPLGKLPSDVGCVVMNVTSVATLYRYIITGMPLVSKRITVDGDCVKVPKNVIVPIGTKIRDILDFVGEISPDANKIIMGGPMMGNSAVNADAVADKRTNAILVMKDKKLQPMTPCIKCGRCVKGCPVNLKPAVVEKCLNLGLNHRLNDLNVNYCMECGSCSFICPAKRPLTSSMRIAKSALRRGQQ